MIQKNHLHLEADLAEINKRKDKFRQFWNEQKSLSFVKNLEESYKKLHNLDKEGKWLIVKSFRTMKTYVATQKKFFKDTQKIQSVIDTFQSNKEYIGQL